MAANENHIVILLSGGIDSSATIVACRDITEDVSTIFIDYGQPAADSEWEAARRIAAHYNVTIKRIELGFSLVDRSGEFFGRNTLFILAAAGVTGKRPLTVALGIHALTDYYDTTPLFVRHVERILNGYSDGEVSLKLPFLANTKPEVIEFAEDRAVPLHLTYSCERQNSPVCSECPSCHSRELFYGN